MRYLELGESAQAGEYRLTVTGLGPARFTLAVGTTERFGTPVENVPNRSDGSAGSSIRGAPSPWASKYMFRLLTAAYDIVTKTERKGEGNKRIRLQIIDA